MNNDDLIPDLFDEQLSIFTASKLEQHNNEYQTNSSGINGDVLFRSFDGNDFFFDCMNENSDDNIQSPVISKSMELKKEDKMMDETNEQDSQTFIATPQPLNIPPLLSQEKSKGTYEQQFLFHLNQNEKKMEEKAQQQLGTIPQQKPLQFEHTNQFFPPQQTPTGTFSKTPTAHIRLIEGFFNPPAERQPGGKDNTKIPLPRQTIKLLVNTIPRGVDIEGLSVRVFVMGHNRVTNMKSYLGTHIDERKFIVNQDGKYVIHFDHLIIKHSSHLHGQRLCIRFTLLDCNKQPVCFIDSEGFATITKRGRDKRTTRKTKRKRPDYLKETSPENKLITLEDIKPAVGVCCGGQLVKLRTQGFIPNPKSILNIKFGDTVVKEIISCKRNTIVVETPAHQPGKVKVWLELDEGDKLVKSNVHFTFVDDKNPESIQLLLQSLFNSNNSFNNINNSSSSSSHMQSLSSGMSTMNFSNHSMGEKPMDQDFAGFNLLHHSTSRGQEELTYMLLSHYGASLALAKDNFDRTPFTWAIINGHASCAILCFEAVYQQFKDDPRCTEKCLSYLSQKDIDGNNIFHFMATKKQPLCERITTYIIKIWSQRVPQLNLLMKLYELITRQPNYSNRTALDIALQDDEEDSEIYLNALLHTIETALHLKFRCFMLHDVTFRAHGAFIGKTMHDCVSVSTVSLYFQSAKAFLLYTKIDGTMGAMKLAPFQYLIPNQHYIEFVCQYANLSKHDKTSFQKKHGFTSEALQGFRATFPTEDLHRSFIEFLEQHVQVLALSKQGSMYLHLPGSAKKGTSSTPTTKLNPLTLQEKLSLMSQQRSRDTKEHIVQ